MAASPLFIQQEIGIMQQQFTVTGMTCGHCEMAVTRAIKQIDGSADVRIDRAQNHVEVDTTQAREAIAAAIREEGYAVAD
jgi:copper chaperone